MVRGSDSRVRGKSIAILADVVRLELERMSRSHGQGMPGAGVRGVESRTLRDAQADAIVGAFFGLVTWWLTSGSRLSAEVVDEIFQHLVAAG